MKEPIIKVVIICMDVLTYTAESGAAKEAFSALAVLLYEAARVDADSASLK